MSGHGTESWPCFSVFPSAIDGLALYRHARSRGVLAVWLADDHGRRLDTVVRDLAAASLTKTRFLDDPESLIQLQATR